MAEWASNDYTLAIGQQTAKGAAAASAQFKLKVVEGSMTPERQLKELVETDASRQKGKTVVVGARVLGNPRVPLRPGDIGLIGKLLLGANATTGAGADKTHEATQADTIGFCTIWESFGGVVISKYVDCQVIGAHFAGQALNELTCGLDIVGLSAVFGAADDAAVPVSEAPFVYPDVTVTRAGVAPGTVDSWTLDVTNGGGFVQGDSGIIPNRYSIGKLMVGGTIVQLADGDADFRKFHAGGAAGVAFSRAIFEESLSIKAAITATLSWEAIMAKVAITEYPLAPDPAGNPTMVAIKFESQPDSAAVANYLKLVAKNQVVAYTTS